MKHIDTLIEVHKIPLYVRVAENFENRPTIVFLHDSLGCVQLWRDFPSRLCHQLGCNMLIYDRQGYGKSAPMTSSERRNDYMETEADILHDIIVDMRLDNIILFGHSDGGSIALIAASKYPSMFRSVIVEAAHLFVEEITLKGIRDAETEYMNTNLKQRLEKYHGDKTDTMFQAWTRTWLSDQFRSWSIEHFLPRIQCPVLFIQGEHDEYGSVRQMDGVVENVKGHVEVFYIPGVGHTPHKEAADKVIDKTSIFLKTLLP